MQVHFGGNWNDLPNVHSIVQGYFVEFSGYNKDPGSHTLIKRHQRHQHRPPVIQGVQLLNGCSVLLNFFLGTP